MAASQASALPRASGLVHVNVRHTAHYTVVGNHLAQRRGMSLAAKGLATYLQSLPAGARVSVKAVAAEHTDTEFRVAAAMRELEGHGYLERVRERLPDGRFVLLTISYNQPKGEIRPAPPTPPGPPAPPTPPPLAPSEPKPAPKPVQKPAPRAEQPTVAPLPEQHRPAAQLLASLRVHEPRLLLSARDVERLAPSLTAWLDRGARADAVVRTLCARLPEDLAHPAGFLAHRLAALVPPELPALAPAPRSPVQQVCEECERPFRSPSAEPGSLCRDCRDVSPHGQRVA
ncbi:helix-turn-helix domain-containing protein [Streptomyces sp. NPDC020807]|uniref:helix-turn-helix domain-containing protein n=1 Tax=Streptomyces sp. NPDC020807 TaxID=3155119 RepID=UPI003401C7EC